MTAYRTALNTLLKEQLIDDRPFVLFGQNVSAGSCLSGLTRGSPPQRDWRCLIHPIVKMRWSVLVLV